MMKIRLLVDIEIEGDYDEEEGAMNTMSEFIGSKIKEESLSNKSFLDLDCYDKSYISKVNVSNVFGPATDRWMEKGDSYYSEKISISEIRDRKISSIIE